MYIIIFIFILILIYIIYQYNHFIDLHKKVERSKSGIDIYLTQRFDLIPNLVECVKQYADYEDDIFVTITEARSKYLQTKNLKDGELVNKQCNTILLQGENYPNLKADEQFIYLQKSLTKMENQLQAARRIYNIDVTNYNTAISTFPASLISSIFHFKEEPFFEPDTNVDVNINL